MGSHHSGEVASRLAVDAIAGFIERSAGGDEFSWPCGIDPALSLDGNRLRTAIYLANRRVFRAAEAHDDYTGMGTTVVCALIAANQAIVGHVGDSRLYLYDGCALRQVTQDDSWAVTIAPQNPRNSAVLAEPALRHVLTSVLGARDQTEIHMTEQPVQAGQRLLLCSDGLHGSLADPDIAAILASAADPSEAARRLVDAALAGGTRDNVSALVVNIDGT
jgi:protein phosphatase